jgi:tetratricopeptide (TPR) repeat protein
MNKQNYLYGIIGLLTGLIIGYIGADAINRSAPAPAASQSLGSAGGSDGSGVELPADHPPTGASGASGDAGSPGSSVGPQGDVMAAIEQARKEPTNYDAQMKAAALFEQIGRGDGALEFYERAAQAKPSDAGLLVKLGNAYFDQKKFADAEKWYLASLKLDSRNATVWLDLGASYYMREPRELDKAIAAYRSALKADPRNEKSLQSLTRALLDKGDKAAARESLKQLEQVAPANTSIPQFRAESN